MGTKNRAPVQVWPRMPRTSRAPQVMFMTKDEDCTWFVEADKYAAGYNNYATKLMTNTENNLLMISNQLCTS